MKRHITISLLLIIAATLSAQEPIVLTGEKDGTTTNVSIENLQAVPSEKKTLVAMDFILDALHVPSNRYRAFTPVIQSPDGTQQQRLKTLIVSGRRQNIVFERDGIDELYAANYERIRRNNDEPQRHQYSDYVDSEPWHKTAMLFVECDLCGCGEQENSQMAPLGTLLPPAPPSPYDLVDYVNAVPQHKAKERNLHGSAYITFVVDRWEMKPDYMNNRRELRKITDTLDVMVADPNVSVKQVKIHGWASPEGSYPHNKMLADNRAKSLTDYVKKQYRLPANVFAPAEATPENWIGLRSAVAEASEQVLPHKQQILATIDKVLADLDRGVTTQADRDEHAIRANYPEEYRYLLREVYPGLRRSDYDISFNFSDFTLDQAKDVYKKRPYQLSLRELWDVANTYEPYSPEYNKVIQTAANIYPDDPEAMINLANVAMKQHDLLKAETLLERAGDSAEANFARGVLAILQGRYDDAQRLLNNAGSKGLDVKKNIEAIEKLK